MPDLWVFGYGSLLWRPGFPYEERRPARLHGFHRSFCVYSHVHRGTPARPGLVLGLDRGGSCVGAAFRVGRGDEAEVRAYLQAREQPTAVYLDRHAPVRLLDGKDERVEALCFVVDRDHHQYAGRLPLGVQAEMIALGRGASGPNPDYLKALVDHLEAENVPDPALQALWRAVGRRLARV